MPASPFVASFRAAGPAAATAPDAGNRINPRKLMNSKWTATPAVDRQKHFVVVKVVFDEAGLVVQECVIEAVLTRRRQAIDWRELMNASRWRFGWR